MKRLAATTVAAMLPGLAFAAWTTEHGGASAKADATNSNIALIIVHCVDTAVIDVYAQKGGPILPADGKGEADYFYKSGAVRAEIDGKAFALAAAGSDDAVVLFGEGTAEQGYLAPFDPALLDALKVGKSLTLSFDITSAQGADGSALETFATFSLEGAGPHIAAAVAPCS